MYLSVHCTWQLAASSSAQELGGSLQGECTNFQAVSGRGLHCVVSGVERYAAQEGESSETLTRHLYSSTEVTLIPSNIQDLVGTAHSKKKYQVSILCPRSVSAPTFLTVLEKPTTCSSSTANKQTKWCKNLVSQLEDKI